MSSPKRVLNRPKKRTLVRWDDDLDQLLLLTVQSVCNKNNVKIPWGEIADTMGHNVTEGAIVQHLAKLRSRRVSAHKPVPPPLRRGGVGSSTTKSTGAKRRRSSATPTPAGGGTRATIPVIDDSSDEDYVDRSETKARGKRVPKGKTPKLAEVPIKTEPECQDESESEVEFMASGASFLALPNDRYATQSAVSSSSSSSGESEDSEDLDAGNSKLVVLKYKKGNNTSKASENDQDGFELTSPMLHMSNTHGQYVHQQPFEPITSHLQYPSGWNGNYMMGHDASGALAPFNYGYDHTLPAMETSNEVEALPSTALQWNIPPVSGSYTGGPGEFDNLFNDNYYYQHGEYMDLPDWEHKPNTDGES